MSRFLTARVVFVTLIVVGALALVLSFVLTPTPNTFAVSNGHRVPVTADMEPVDYAILFLRIGGALVLLGGAYLASRARHPRRAVDEEGPPAYVPGDPAGWAADTTASRATRRF
ncbi:MAG: hypothetical protein ACRDQC_03830 [Gaiellales bacterium]